MNPTETPYPAASMTITELPQSNGTYTVYCFWTDVPNVEEYRVTLNRLDGKLEILVTSHQPLTTLNRVHLGHYYINLEIMRDGHWKKVYTTPYNTPPWTAPYPIATPVPDVHALVQVHPPIGLDTRFGFTSDYVVVATVLLAGLIGWGWFNLNRNKKK